MPGTDKRIAVIAVHGVGDQAPFETAQHIGDLLQSLNAGETAAASPAEDSPPRSESPAYYPFHEDTIRLDVRPTVVHPDGDAWQESGIRGPFDAWVKRTFRRKASVSDDEIWYQFTRGQLAGYHREDRENTYETVRMEGERAPSQGHPGCAVHVYELYWADLSRLKAGALSVFTELYQLLFHLPSLGTHTVNASASHHTRSSIWRIYKWLQGSTAVLLTLPIVVFNLLLVGLLGVVLGLNLVAPRLPRTQVLILICVGVVLIVWALGAVLWRILAKHRVNSLVWLAPLFLGVALVLIAGDSRMMSSCSAATLQIIESLLLAAVVSVLLTLVFVAYDRRRPGSRWWAGLLSIIVLCAGAASYSYSSPDPAAHGGALVAAPVNTNDCDLKNPAAPSLLQSRVMMFWVREFEVTDICLAACWAAFFLLGLVTVVVGFFAARRSEPTRRSWWTGVLMLSLPALCFLIVTVALWYVIATSGWRFLPETNYFPLWSRFQTRHVLDMAKILQADLESILGVLLPCAGAALLPAIWGLAPVAWTEVLPPAQNDNSMGDLSRRLGRWLTLAFTGLNLSGLVLYLATMIGLPVLAVAYLVRPEILPPWLHGTPGLFSTLSGIGLAALLLLRGRLRKLALGFRPVLDMLLDVDNWFREHPRKSNPKARICGRYVSLLRYIANWKDHSAADAQHPEGKGYDGIVIIAHSQGTVITADLLRFLKCESNRAGSLTDYDPQLAPLQQIPIVLFTMGCPLRQLYGLRFPNLYHWARHDSHEAMRTWKADDLPERRPPDPDDLLSVNLWVNCYRSGDYVGRYLWRTDDCDYAWNGDCCGYPVNAPSRFNSTEGRIRSEFCIGAGAHTHYWDRTAHVVAQELHRLIGTL